MSTRFIFLSAMIMGAAGCSTDSTQPAGDAGGGCGGGGGGSSGAAGSAGADSGSHAGGSVSLGDAAHASPECVTFCTCMAKNCADKVFPGGCLSACAAGTSWDLPCRQNMCKLVPDQPDNDHCTHAFGTSQCN